MALKRNSERVPGGFGGNARFPGISVFLRWRGLTWGLERLLRKLPVAERAHSKSM